MQEVAFKKEIEELREMRKLFETGINKISGKGSDHNEIKNMLIEQNKELKAFKERVEPMILIFEKDQVKKIIIKDGVMTIRTFATWVTAVTGSGIIIKYFFKYLFQWIIK